MAHRHMRRMFPRDENVNARGEPMDRSEREALEGAPPASSTFVVPTGFQEPGRPEWQGLTVPALLDEPDGEPVMLGTFDPLADDEPDDEPVTSVPAKKPAHRPTKRKTR